MNSLTKQTLKIFWQHGKKYKWQVVVLIVGIIGVTVIQTLTPVYYGKLINVLASSEKNQIFKQAVYLLVVILLLNIFRIIVWRLVNFVNNFFQPRVMADLLNTCYEYLHKHPYNFFSSSFVGSLVTKIKRYERSFEQISDQISFELGRSLLDTGSILIAMLWLYPKLAVYVFIWCLLYLLFSYAYSIFKLPYDIKRAAADTKTTAQLADSITNNINIKLFTNYERENKRFFGVTQEQFALRKKSWDLGTIGDLIQSLLMIGLEFLIIYLGIKDWQRNVLQVGDIALIQFYLLRISDKLWNTGRNIRNIYEAIADANEMTEILVKPHEVVDKSKARVFKFRQGAIEFSKVFFTYKEGVEVLRDFDLQIKPGEKVALIGSSGGGKSTLIKLLFRFYDIQNGKIVIDGQDISAVTQDSLRKNLSLVPQDPILFHRSLMENIRYGKPEASEAEVIEASRIAHCHEFISRFPQGYETLVGERGVKLSGGERQRVAIARAVLKNAPILVLDEATSSLDSESEMLIQDALKKLMKGKTVIVVAHRLSTIMQMDRIIVIDGGRIVEEGKHKELLKAQEGIYQKLWNIQAGGFGK